MIEMEDNSEVEEISANRQNANVSLSNTPELIRLLKANPNPKLGLSTYSTFLVFNNILIAVGYLLPFVFSRNYHLSDSEPVSFLS